MMSKHEPAATESANSEQPKRSGRGSRTWTDSDKSQAGARIKLMNALLRDAERVRKIDTGLTLADLQKLVTDSGADDTTAIVIECDPTAAVAEFTVETKFRTGSQCSVLILTIPTPLPGVHSG